MAEKDIHKFGGKTKGKSQKSKPKSGYSRRSVERVCNIKAAAGEDQPPWG